MDKQAVFLVSPLGQDFSSDDGGRMRRAPRERQGSRVAGGNHPVAGDGDRRLPPAPGLPAAGYRAEVFPPCPTTPAHWPMLPARTPRAGTWLPGNGPSRPSEPRNRPGWDARAAPGENCANLRSFLTRDEAAGLFRVSRRPVTATATVLGRESRDTGAAKGCPFGAGKRQRRGRRRKGAGRGATGGGGAWRCAARRDRQAGRERGQRGVGLAGGHRIGRNDS